MSTDIIVYVVKEGSLIVLGAVALGYIFKALVRNTVLQKRLIPLLNGVVCVAATITIPTLFVGFDVVSKGILGLVCALLASLFYDKIITAIVDTLHKNKDSAGGEQTDGQ